MASNDTRYNLIVVNSLAPNDPNDYMDFDTLEAAKAEAYNMLADDPMVTKILIEKRTVVEAMEQS